MTKRYTIQQIAEYYENQPPGIVEPLLAKFNQEVSKANDAGTVAYGIVSHPEKYSPMTKQLAAIWLNRNGYGEWPVEFE